MVGFSAGARPASAGIDILNVVEGFTVSELLDNQAVKDMPWLPSLIAPSLYGKSVRCGIPVHGDGECHAVVRCGGIFVRAVAKNGRHGIDEVLKMLVYFSPTKS